MAAALFFTERKRKKREGERGACEHARSNPGQRDKEIRSGV
jgi:hypothetical protein